MIETEIFVGRRKGLYIKKDKGTRFYCLWKEPTVGDWRKITGFFFGEGRTPSQFDLEPLFWKFCSVENNLGGEAEEVLKFSPSWIPSYLFASFFRKIHPTEDDLYRIKQECHRFWGTDNGTLSDPHPFLRELVISMGLHQSFGVPPISSVEEMSYRMYVVYQTALDIYTDSQNKKIKSMANKNPVTYR